MDLVNVFIFQEKFSPNVVFSIALKIVFSQVGSYILNNRIENYLESEIQRIGLTNKESYRKNILLKIRKNFNQLKYSINLILLGLALPINLEKLIKRLIELVTYFFYKLKKRPKGPIDITPKKAPLPLPEIIKVVLEKAKDPVIQVPVKIPVKLDQIRMQRECQFIKEYVLTQKELVAEMNKGQSIRETIGERITKYCTENITIAIKKAIQKIKNQPIAEGMRMVKKQGDKVNDGIDFLQIALNNGQPRQPNDLKKYISLSKDLAWTMRCLDSYIAFLQKDMTPEKLEYLKQKVLPDLFVILVAMNKEMKK